MAKVNAEVPPNEWDSEDWEVVAEPRTKATFDEIGDKVIGTWVGFEDIVRPDTGEIMKYCNFDDALAGSKKGAPTNVVKLTISASYQLVKDLENVPHGRRVMLEYISETAVRQGNPLKNFRVSVR